MPAELRFHAMGSDVHVLVVGGSPALVTHARRRIAQLEQRWSRFRTDSEVSELNRRAGETTRVSPDTMLLVQRALDAIHLTGGLFDPTVLGAVIRAGYNRSFDPTVSFDRGGESNLTRGTLAIDGDAVRLPAGTGFDPGGLGKGLAADLVVRELLDGGADGTCVNLGGDVRVAGAGPDGGDWTIAVHHPDVATPLARLGLRDGAVASSSTLRRSWRVGTETRHHLIDPASGLPSASDITFATVVAGSAWAADVLAKAIIVRGTPHHFDVVSHTGAEALAVDRRGTVGTTFGFAHYTGHAALEERIR